MAAIILLVALAIYSGYIYQISSSERFKNSAWSEVMGSFLETLMLLILLEWIFPHWYENSRFLTLILFFFLGHIVFRGIRNTFTDYDRV